MSVSRLRARSSLPFAAALLAVALVSLSAPQAAHAGGSACQNPGALVTQAETRFRDVAPGNVIATGNTLGLSKEAGLNGPGIADSIGAFIALDPTDADDTPANSGNPWFAGTTFDWRANGSSAALALPTGSTVLRAELVWGGSFADDVLANLGDSVQLLFGGEEIAVAPEGVGIDIDQAATDTTPRFRYYARKADVTSFVQSHGVGDYTVAGVPALQSEAVNSLHAAGWTLLVAYRDQAQPIRNLTLFFGGAFVNENTTQDYRFSEFCASPSGDLEGSAVITALEGDANRPGDVLCIAPTETPEADNFVTLSGPNNPADNFFSSQINDADGALDTRGTFGARNHDAFSATNISGGRQGWDITQLSLSSDDGSLAAGQTGATLRTATASDSYLPMAAGFSIDVNAPFFDPDQGNATEIDASSVEIGDTVTLTVNLFNSGEAPADNLLFVMPLPNGLSLQGFTSDGADGDITGDPVDQSELDNGVPQGTLGSADTRVVTATLRVDAAPSGTVFNLQPAWTYDWIMCAGEEPFSENFAAASSAVDFIPENPATTASSSGGNGGAGGTSGTASAQGGGTATNVGGGNGDEDEDGSDEDGSDEDGGAGGDNGDDFVAQGGVMCAANTAPSGRGAGAFAAGLALALGAIAARRRRG